MKILLHFDGFFNYSLQILRMIQLPSWIIANEIWFQISGKWKMWLIVDRVEDGGGYFSGKLIIDGLVAKVLLTYFSQAIIKMEETSKSHSVTIWDYDTPTYTGQAKKHWFNFWEIALPCTVNFVWQNDHLVWWKSFFPIFQMQIWGTRSYIPCNGRRIKSVWNV